MKQLGKYTVKVHRENDPVTGQARAVGSQITGPKGTFKVSHWPARIVGVEESGDQVLVQTGGGSRPYLTDDKDRLTESQIEASDRMVETGVPDAHYVGQLRFLVHGYSGTQAALAGKMVEAGLTKHTADRLAGWVSRQARAMKKWRDTTSAMRESDPVVLMRALERSPFRLIAGAPQLPEGFLEGFLIESWVKLAWPTGIGTTPQGGDAFVTLAEYDARLNAESLCDTEVQLREAARFQADCGPLVLRWLSLHGDPRSLQESEPGYLNAVAERVVRGTGPLRPRSELDQRVIEAQLIGVLREDDGVTHVAKGENIVSSPANRTTPAPVLEPTKPIFTAADGASPTTEVGESARVRPGDLAPCGHKIREGRRVCGCGQPYDPLVEAPLDTPKTVVQHLAVGPWSAAVRRVKESGWVVKGEPAPRATLEIFKEGATVLATFDDAGERIAEAQITEADDMCECGGMLRECGDDASMMECASCGKRIARKLREASLPDEGQRQAPAPSDAERAGVHTSERALALGKEPPNLRRGHVGMRCGFCEHFEGGNCKKYQYPVSAGELCDSYSKRITEAEAIAEAGKSPWPTHPLGARVTHSEERGLHGVVVGHEMRQRGPARMPSGEKNTGPHIAFHKVKWDKPPPGETKRTHLEHPGDLMREAADPFLVESVVEDVLAESPMGHRRAVRRPMGHRRAVGRHYQHPVHGRARRVTRLGNRRRGVLVLWEDGQETVHDPRALSMLTRRAERIGAEGYHQGYQSHMGEAVFDDELGEARSGRVERVRQHHGGRPSRVQGERTLVHHHGEVAGYLINVDGKHHAFVRHPKGHYEHMGGDEDAARATAAIRDQWGMMRGLHEARWDNLEYFGPEDWDRGAREDYDAQIRHHRRAAVHHERQMRRHAGTEQMYHHMAMAEYHRGRAKQFSRDVRHAQRLGMEGVHRHHRESEFTEASHKELAVKHFKAARLAKRGGNPLKAAAHMQRARHHEARVPGGWRLPRLREAAVDEAREAGDHWMQGAVKHPGALHRALGVPEGEKIPPEKLEAALRSKDPAIRRMAALAKTFGRARH